jgi:hypothetical protein
MYIGSTGQRGLHHLVYEILDNAVDEVQGGHATDVWVELDLGTGWVTVRDNGRRALGRALPCWRLRRARGRARQAWGLRRFATCSVHPRYALCAGASRPTCIRRRACLRWRRC